MRDKYPMVEDGTEPEPEHRGYLDCMIFTLGELNDALLSISARLTRANDRIFGPCPQAESKSQDLCDPECGRDRLNEVVHDYARLLDRLKNEMDRLEEL